MKNVTKEQYKIALAKIEELLPLVDDNTPANDTNAILLTIFSDIVIEYEEKHYQIDKPTTAQIIAYYIEEKGYTKKQIAEKLNISPSRISDYISGRAEPSLKIASSLCSLLGIPAESMLSL